MAIGWPDRGEFAAIPASKTWIASLTHMVIFAPPDSDTDPPFASDYAGYFLITTFPLVPDIRSPVFE